MEFVRDLFDVYDKEILSGFFVFFCFYINYINKKRYEDLLLKKQNLEDRYHEAKYKLNNPSDAELMFGNPNDLETDKDLEKRYDKYIKDTQAEFDSKTLLNIETALVVLLLLILYLTIYFFKA